MDDIPTTTADDGCDNDLFEPNNVRDQATQFSLGTNQASGVVCPLDKDIYQFFLCSEGHVTVTLNFDHDIGDLDLRLSSVANEELVLSETSDDNEGLTFSNPDAFGSFHYVEVYGFDEASAPYELTVVVTCDITTTTSTTSTTTSSTTTSFSGSGSGMFTHTSAPVTTTPAVTTYTSTSTTSESELLCSPYIASLPVGAEANCGNETMDASSFMEGATCTATCANGLVPTGNPTYVCRNGEWVGGCRFTCTSWAPHGRSVYLYSRKVNAPRASYERASEICSTLGATLALIDTPAENRFLFNLNPDTSSLRWIGLQRSSPGSDTFVWADGRESNASAMYTADIYDGNGGEMNTDEEDEDAMALMSLDRSYVRWHKGEPRAAETHRNCVQMGLPGGEVEGGWSVSRCRMKRHYVCELPLPDVGECGGSEEGGDDSFTTTTSTTTTTTDTLSSSTTAATTGAADGSSSTATAVATTTTAMSLYSFILRVSDYGEWLLRHSSEYDGTRFSTVYNSEVSTKLLQSWKSETDLRRFTVDCAQETFLAGGVAMYVRVATNSYLCYSLTDTGRAVSTSETSNSWVLMS